MGGRAELWRREDPQISSGVSGAERRWDELTRTMGRIWTDEEGGESVRLRGGVRTDTGQENRVGPRNRSRADGFLGTSGKSLC